MPVNFLGEALCFRGSLLASFFYFCCWANSHSRRRSVQNLDSCSRAPSHPRRLSSLCALRLGSGPCFRMSACRSRLTTPLDRGTLCAGDFFSPLPGIFFPALAASVLTFQFKRRGSCRGLVRRSCQDSSFGDLVPRHCKQFCRRDLAKKSLI